MGAVGAPVPPKPRFRPFTGFGCVENDVENAAEGAALPIPRPPLLVSADVLPAPPNPKLGVACIAPAVGNAPNVGCAALVAGGAAVNEKVLAAPVAAPVVVAEKLPKDGVVAADDEKGLLVVPVVLRLL
jgi:hypothetical protein